MWPALAKTLGVPLFQEQLMELAVDVAGFGPGEADELRRAMGSKRSTARMNRLKDRLYQGMRQHHGIESPVADRIFEKMLAFANYGFAESHALAFAGLVFHSAWLKLHHPAAFLVGLLRAQPMGFYSPQSLVADARRHRVLVHRPDINLSAAPADPTRHDDVLAVRLGLDQVRSIGITLAEQIIQQRPAGGYTSIDHLTQMVELTAPQVEALATAGALDTLTPPGHGGTDSTRRRATLWAAGPAGHLNAGTIPGSGAGSTTPELPGINMVEIAAADMWATGITPDQHPVEFSRPPSAAGRPHHHPPRRRRERHPSPGRRRRDPPSTTGQNSRVHLDGRRNRPAQRHLPRRPLHPHPQPDPPGPRTARPRRRPTRRPGHLHPGRPDRTHRPRRHYCLTRLAMTPTESSFGPVDRLSAGLHPYITASSECR